MPDHIISRRMALVPVPVLAPPLAKPALAQPSALMNCRRPVRRRG